MISDARKQHILLKDKRIYKGLLVLALPLMLSNLLKSIHDIVDMYFVGGLGEGSISSISITWSMIFIFLSFSFGLSAAGMAIISQYLGSGNIRTAKKTTGQLLLISIVIGVLSNAILYIVSPYLLELSGATGYVYENALKYVRIRSFEMLPIFVFSAYHANRQAGGDTVSPVILTVIAIVLNIILSPTLIIVFDMGVAGAGLATLIANIVIMPFAIHYLFNAKDGVTIGLNDVKPDKEIIPDILKIAIPNSFAQSVTAIGFTVMNAMILSNYGAVVYDAFGIGNRVNSLTLLPIIAVGQVLSTFIGQNVGARNVDRAKEIFRKSIIFTIGLSLLGALIVIPFREQIARIFLESERSISLARTYMLYLTLTLPFFAIFQLQFGVFRGLGNAKYVVILSITRLWGLRIPMILVFVYLFNMSENSVWHAMWISNILAVAIGLLLYRRCSFEPIIREELVEQFT